MSGPSKTEAVREETTVGTIFDDKKREVEGRKKDRGEIKTIIQVAIHSGVKQEIKRNVDEDLKKFRQELNVLSRVSKSFQNLKNRLFQTLKGIRPLGYDFPGDVRDLNTLKGQMTDSWATLTALINVFKETKDTSEELVLPQNSFHASVTRKLFEEFLNEPIIRRETAPYILTLISSLYEEKSDPTSWLSKEDWFYLFVLDPFLASNILRVIRSKIREVKGQEALSQFDEFFKDVKEEMRDKGVDFLLQDEREFFLQQRGQSPRIEFSQEEVARLDEYWRRVGRAQGFVKERIKELDERINNAINRNDRDTANRLKEEKERLENEIRTVDRELFEKGEVRNAINIIHKWVRAGIIPPDSAKDIVFVSEDEIQDFMYLNGLALAEEEKFLRAYVGIYFDPTSLGLNESDFYVFTPGYLAKEFRELFEWDDERGRLVFKEDKLQVHTLRTLYKILRFVGKDYSEEWGKTFDQAREGVAIKLLKFLITIAMAQAAPDGKLSYVLKDLAREKGISYEEIEHSFVELMNNLRILVDGEFTSYAFTHEFFRLFMYDKLGSFDDLIRIYQAFDAERSSLVYGGIHKELIDLAARVFEMTLEDYLAHNKNQIDSGFFRSIFDPKVIYNTQHPASIYRIFLDVSLTYLKENPEFREKVGISEEDLRTGVVLDYLERAWHYGLVRSLMERALGIIASMEPLSEFDFRDYPLPDMILATFDPRHMWQLGRGDESLSKIMFYVLNAQIREKAIRKLKAHVPEALWNEINNRHIKALKDLIGVVGDVEALIAERLVAEYGVDTTLREFKYLIEFLGIAPVEDRGGWREEEALKMAYDKYLKPHLGRGIWEDVDKDFIDIARAFGTSILWRNIGKWIDKKIKKPIFTHYLGEGYSYNYAPADLEEKKKKIFSSKKYSEFKDLNGNTLEITVEEFVRRKEWMLKGRILYMTYRRNPLGFVNLVTRLAPELEHMFKIGDKLVPTYKLLFEYNDREILDFCRRGGMGKVEANEFLHKILKYRTLLKKEWNTSHFSDLKEISRAWWELRKEVFELLKRKGVISQDKVWEKDGDKYKDLLDKTIGTANIKLVRRLLLDDPHERPLDLIEWVNKNGLDSLSEEEKIIWKVFFDPTNNNRIGAHFDSIDFAVSKDKVFWVYGGLEQKDFFTQTAQVWSLRKNPNMFPISGAEDRASIIEFVAKSAGVRMYMRDANDRNFVQKEGVNKLQKLEDALSNLAKTGDYSQVEEILKGIKSLGERLDEELMYKLNEHLIEIVCKFMMDHTLIRLLPPPFDAIAKFLFGKNAALSKILGGGSFRHSWSDEQTRQFIRDMVIKGYIKEEHMKRIEFRLFLNNEIYALKAGTKLFFIILIIMLLYFIKKALEEETKESS